MKLPQPVDFGHINMLITTKIKPPALRSGLLFREALVQQLDKAAGYPVISISGPAGSGKTSVVCQWIQRFQLRVAWYALDEEDNDPDLFFRYLLAVLARSDEQLHKAFRPMLENQRALNGQNVIPHLLITLFSLHLDIYLILDDLHRITNPSIHHALGRLIQYSPAHLHMVLLGRAGLPAPIDAVAFKKEHLAITSAELKFTPKEATALYREVIPLGLTPGQIRDLYQYMEGWAAGLQLVGLSAGTRQDPPDLSAILDQAHEQVANYLIADILQKQPEKIRRFIFTTALLDRFDPGLCAEVTGMPDAAGILDSLERMNFFLVPLYKNGNGRKKWYRYHHMFCEVIRRLVATFDAASIAETLRKAALWSARNDYPEDALRLAFRSEDMEFTAGLLEDHVMHYVDTFDIAAGLKWIAKLPKTVLDRSALLRLQQCSFLSVLMELSDVKEIIAAIEISGKPDFSRYTGHKLALCQDLFAYFKCLLHIYYADQATALEEFQTLQCKIHPQNQLLAGIIETHLVCMLISRGELSVAEFRLNRLLQAGVAGDDHLLKTKVYLGQAKALIAKNRGRLRQAEAIIQQVLQFFNQQGYDHLPISFFLYRHLGTIYYLQNKLADACRCAAGTLKYCETFGLVDEMLAGNELQLQLHLAAGEHAQADQCIRKIESFSLKFGMPQLIASVEASAARYALDQGNPAAAELWAQRRNVRPDEPFSLLLAMECLILARLYFVQECHDDAVHLLKTLRKRCVKRGLEELVLHIDILHAATLQASHLQEEALSVLNSALVFAETEGYVRPFVNDAKAVAPILRRIRDGLPRNGITPFLKTVLAACQISPHKPAIPPVPVMDNHEQLSQREIEILRWMAQGFRNKDIAQKGRIAITTVKTHVSSIFSKLNVKSRTHAILKAREMKLVEANVMHRAYSQNPDGNSPGDSTGHS